MPEHWEARRLGTFAAVLNGATPSTNVSTYWDGKILWVTPDDLGKLRNRYVTGSTRRITEEGYKSCGTSMAPANSLAISTRAPIGHLGILRSEGCVNQGCRLLVPTPSIQTEYLHYSLNTSRSILASLGQGSTFAELSRTQLSGFHLPLPPLPEQTRHRPLPGPRRPAHPPLRQTPSASSSPCWRRRSRPSSTRPSPAASTPTSGSSPPASSGSATCPSTGRCGAPSSFTGKSMNDQPLAQRSLMSVSHITGVTPTKEVRHNVSG